MSQPLWCVLRDAWEPYLGPMAEERARNAAMVLMARRDPDEGQTICTLTRTVSMLNCPPYAGHLSGETIADAVTAAIEALSSAYGL